MKPEFRTLAAALGTALALCTASFAAAWEETPTEDNMSDPYVKRLSELVGNHTPPDPDPDPDSFGMDKASGKFIHPAMTRDSHDPHPFEGRLDYWDTEQYIKNMTIEAYYPITVEPFHTWQNMVDFDGRRYLYQYVRRDLKIFDVTDPKNVKLLLTKGNTWGAEGAGEDVNPYPEDDYFGAATIQWNQKLGVNVMVQSFEIRRFGLLKNKYTQPDKVQAIRDSKQLKGFKVYAMHGPLPEDWKLLAERSSDYQHPDAPIGQQQGSGARDIPTWFGGDTLYIAAAPDASHALTEYPNDLYSAGYQAWDMSDPARPKFVSQLTMPGQIIGDADSEAIYKRNPRAGNRTSWMGARMSLFMPDGDSQHAYAAMGGLGFYVVDISDPNKLEIVSHLEFEPNVAGVEGDFVDVSQVKATGLVYTSGYPLNEDCWEPYKDVFIVDVNDPKNPTVVGTLPRPTPPAEAKFTDYCQRRGSFGPKRTGAYTQPGVGRKDVLPFNFYNAGLQVYDVSNPQKAEISAYFVPPFNTERVVDYARGNLSHAVFVEYDRNLFWLFTNHGFYVLSSPVLGKPNLGAPKTVWPAR